MKKQWLLLFPVFLFFTIFTFFISDNFFFWDTIKIVSLPANYIFDNTFQVFFLADEFDTGHMPIFPMYLALAWALFSKTLLVSHFSMLPFIFGVIWQSYLLICNYVQDKKKVILILLLTLFNPMFLSQASLVSPDILLLFFFLLGLNSLKIKNNIFYSLAIIGLFTVSTRGIMMVAILALIEFTLLLKEEDIYSVFKNKITHAYKYLPGVVLLVMFNWSHYLHSGWILLNPNPTWSEGHVSNDLKRAVFNVGIYAWRLTDFGMLFMWFILTVLFVKNRRKIIKNLKIRSLLVSFIVLIIVFLMLYLRYGYFTQHRYLLPIYFLLSIFTGYLIVEYVKSKRLKNTIFVFLFLGLLSGNFWVYPNKIAQGWDSTLAHLPYYSLQREMITYLKQENIKFENVGAEFPALAEQKLIMLNNDSSSFKPKEVGKDEYILYSTINNDFTDKELELLQTTYHVKKEFKSFQIVVQLFNKDN